MRKKEFTLIELLVVIAIIAILAGMLLPSLSSARNRVKSIDCTNKMRTLGIYWQFYLDGNNDSVLPVVAPYRQDGIADWFFGLIYTQSTGFPIYSDTRWTEGKNKSLFDYLVCPLAETQYGFLQQNGYSRNYSVKAAVTYGYNPFLGDYCSKAKNKCGNCVHYHNGEYVGKLSHIKKSLSSYPVIGDTWKKSAINNVSMDHHAGYIDFQQACMDNFFGGYASHGNRQTPFLFADGHVEVRQHMTSRELLPRFL